jgi:hypothetical protein
MSRKILSVFSSDIFRQFPDEDLNNGESVTLKHFNFILIHLKQIADPCF